VPRSQRAFIWERSAKWCLAWAARCDRPAVNYVSLGILANIQYLLGHYPEALSIRLLEATWADHRAQRSLDPLAHALPSSREGRGIREFSGGEKRTHVCDDKGADQTRSSYRGG
jgi:hypothetical protein